MCNFLQEILHLQFIRQKALHLNIFFIRVTSELMTGTSTPCNGDTGATVVSDSCAARVRSTSSLELYQQLINLEFRCTFPGLEEGALASEAPIADADSDSFTAECELVESLDNFGSIATFVRNSLQHQLLSAVALINVVHVRCLEMMISMAFDMAWDVMFTPKRLKYAREKEVCQYPIRQL